MATIARGISWLALAGFVALALMWQAPQLAPGELRLSFLDVGQGDAVLIQAPNGVSALVDGGPPGSVLSPLAAALPGGRSLAAVVATHPDQDHVGGLPSVLARREVATLLASPYRSGEPAETALAQVAAGRHVATGTLVRGDRLALDLARGVYVDILWPPPGLPLASGNNASIVALLRYGSSSALLTGDAPRGVERLLVAAEDPLAAQILKPGHHGSKTATDPVFVAAVSPRVAVISAGVGNRYGHPAPQTLTTLASARVPVESTLGQGTLTFSTFGDGSWRELPRGG